MQSKDTFKSNQILFSSIRIKYDIFFKFKNNFEWGK